MTENQQNTLPGAETSGRVPSVIATASGFQIKASMKDSLWLIEYYTKGGSIRFAWVFAASGVHAKSKLSKIPDADFDESIQTTEQAAVCPLALSTGNYAIVIS